LTIVELEAAPLCRVCPVKKDCPAYRGAMKQIRQGKIRTLAAMCEALAEQPLQNEPGWNSLW